MSVNIKVGHHTLRSDAHGWQLSEQDTVKKGKNKGKEVYRYPTFYANLDQALRAMQDRFLRDSDATSLEELRQELDYFRSRIAGLFAMEARYDR